MSLSYTALAKAAQTKRVCGRQQQGRGHEECGIERVVISFHFFVHFTLLYVVYFTFYFNHFKKYFLKSSAIFINH
jgi:hypothetical protein